MRHHSRSGRSILRRVAGDIGPERRKVVAAAVLITVSRLGLAFVPMVSGSLVDRISAEGAFGQALVPSCVLLGVLVLVGYGMDSITGAMMLKVADRCIRRLRDKAVQKMNRLPLPFLDMHPAGDIQSRLTADMVTLSSALQTSVNIVSQTVLFVTVIVLIVFLSDGR